MSTPPFDFARDRLSEPTRSSSLDRSGRVRAGMSLSMPLTLEEALEKAEEALEEGEFEETVASADQALALSPGDADALYLKGLGHAGLGELEAADEALAAVLAKEPQNATVMLDAADVKIREADDPARIEAGLELLRRAERLVRQDEELQQQLELLRGIALSQLGEHEAALEAFGKVLQLEPEHGEAQLERAVALFELGRFPEAKKAFEKLVRDYPEEAWPFHYLGLLAERRGEDPEPLLAQARALDPEEFPPAIHLSAEAFDAAVADAIEKLPEHARPHLANAIISAQPLPSDEDLKEGLSPTILGVFTGTPIDERLALHAAHHETVRITLFQKNLERFARTREELLEEIRITVLHEVGHLLGLDEDELFDRGLD